MPAFIFEKISSSVHRAPTDPITRKQRGVIGQLIDRLFETRAKRSSRRERSGRRDQKSE